jgi:hypothetical protein
MGLLKSVVEKLIEGAIAQISHYQGCTDRPHAGIAGVDAIRQISPSLHWRLQSAQYSAASTKRIG